MSNPNTLSPSALNTSDLQTGLRSGGVSFKGAKVMTNQMTNKIKRQQEEINSLKQQLSNTQNTTERRRLQKLIANLTKQQEDTQKKYDKLVEEKGLQNKN